MGRIQKLHCSKKWELMTTHQSSHLTPAPLPSAWASPPTKTGGFALFGHTLGVRRDLSPLCESFLLCVLSMGRKHFPLQYFALVLGAQTRCYVSAGLCAAKRRFTKMNGFSQGRSFVCVCGAAEKMLSSSLDFQSLCKTSGMKSLFISHLFHFQGTTISVATWICLFSLQQVLLWFIL